MGRAETENIIKDRLKKMFDMTRELKNANLEFGKINQYCRIRGESYRAVSLNDDRPLCGYSMKGHTSLEKIKEDFLCKPKDQETLKNIYERKFQCFLIRNALQKNRDLLEPLKLQNGPFKELHFALDEVSMGDKKNSVQYFFPAETKPRIVRCDLLAVGKINSKVVPVIIELKYSRSWKRLKEQLVNFACLLQHFRAEFDPLLKACTGYDENISRDTKPYMMAIWPKKSTQISPFGPDNFEVCCAEYSEIMTGSISWLNLSGSEKA